MEWNEREMSETSLSLSLLNLQIVFTQLLNVELHAWIWIIPSNYYELNYTNFETFRYPMFLLSLFNLISNSDTNG